MSLSDLRRGEDALARLATNDLAALWRQVSNAVEARQALEDILPSLLRTYGQAAASLAADWYDEARLAAEVGGAFTAIPADFDAQGSRELAAWATGRGTDLDSVLTLVAGGMQRRLMAWSRDTVMGSALADPRADGWQRVGLGSCAFCAMLIGRGAVYSESTADFASHDHCHCSAAPAFKGRPRPVLLDENGKRIKVSSRGHRTDDRQRRTDNARVRSWLEDHPNAG